MTSTSTAPRIRKRVASDGAPPISSFSKKVLPMFPDNCVTHVSGYSPSMSPFEGGGEPVRVRGGCSESRSLLMRVPEALPRVVYRSPFRLSRIRLYDAYRWRGTSPSSTASRTTQPGS